MSDALALLRIEHKLDLLLHAAKHSDPVLAALLADKDAQLATYGQDTCPVCAEAIQIVFDPANEFFRRECGCRPPFRVVAGISGLLVGPKPEKSTVLHLDRSLDLAPLDPDPEPIAPKGTTP